MYGHDVQHSMNQPSMVVNPSRGRLSRSRLKIWSRETGSAVPSRVSSLILHTQAEFTHGLHSRAPLSATASFYTFNHHRVNPEFIGSRKYVPVALTDASRPAQVGSTQGSSSNGFCLFRKPYGSFFVRPSFPTSTILIYYYWYGRQVRYRQSLSEASAEG